MAKANAKLDALHVALLDYLLARIHGTRVVIEGKEELMPLPASELAVMAKILKDNGIVADKDHADDLLKLQEELAAEMKSGANRDEILATALDKIADDSGFMH